MEYFACSTDLAILRIRVHEVLCDAMIPELSQYSDLMRANLQFAPENSHLCDWAGVARA